MNNATEQLYMVLEPISQSYGKPKKMRVLGAFTNEQSAEAVKNDGPGREVRPAKALAEENRRERVRQKALRKLTQEEKELLNLLPAPVENPVVLEETPGVQVGPC